MSYDNTLSRLPDPTTTPQGPGFNTLGLVQNTPGMLHPLNTGGSVSVKFSGSFWTITIGYPSLEVNEAEHLIPFIYSLEDNFTTFYVQLPTYVNPKSGQWDESTSVKLATGDIAIGADSRTIVIPDWDTRGGDYEAGDMLKFSNSHKLYMVKQTSIANNTKTIKLTTDIIELDKIPTAGFEPNDLKFRVRQQGTTPTLTLTPDGLFQAFSLALKENIL